MQTTKKALVLILMSSLCAGVGQLFWKKASFSLNLNIISLINEYLVIGIALYLFATFLMVLSFREGELSVLHPFLATSYVWVTLIAPVFIVTETISFPKIAGVMLIFLGVVFICVGGKKANE